MIQSDDSSGGHAARRVQPISCDRAGVSSGGYASSGLPMPGTARMITLCPSTMSSSDWSESASGRRDPVHEASWHTCQLVSCYRVVAPDRKGGRTEAPKAVTSVFAKRPHAEKRTAAPMFSSTKTKPSLAQNVLYWPAAFPEVVWHASRPASRPEHAPSWSISLSLYDVRRRGHNSRTDSPCG